MIRRVEPQREPLPTSIATSLETLRRGIRRYIWAESLRVGRRLARHRILGEPPNRLVL